MGVVVEYTAWLYLDGQDKHLFFFNMYTCTNMLTVDTTLNLNTPCLIVFLEPASFFV